MNRCKCGNWALILPVQVEIDITGLCKDCAVETAQSDARYLALRKDPDALISIFFDILTLRDTPEPPVCGDGVGISEGGMTQGIRKEAAIGSLLGLSAGAVFIQLNMYSCAYLISGILIIWLLDAAVWGIADALRETKGEDE